MRWIVLILGLVMPCQTFAEGWACRNTDMEISCGDDGCESETVGFTPMQVSVDHGYLQVCAYTDCWVGDPTILSNADAFYAYASSLRSERSGTSDLDPAQIAINLDRKLAVMNWGGFAHPMQCENWTCGEDCKSN